MRGNATTIAYNPNANFHGADSFDYAVFDWTHTDRRYSYGAVALDQGIPRTCDY